MQDMETSDGGILGVGVRCVYGIDTTPHSALSTSKQPDHTFHKIIEGPPGQVRTFSGREIIISFAGHRVTILWSSRRLGPV